MGSNNNDKAKSYWKIILEFSEQNVRFLIWWFFLSGLFLFIPSQAIDFLHLAWFYDYFGWLAGLIFLGAGTLLIIDFLYSVVNIFKRRIYIGCLGEDEKEILRFYFIKTVKSQPVDASSGAAALLLENGILCIGTNLAKNCGMDGIFNELVICDWAWKYLKKHQDLIDIEKGIEEVFPVD